MKDQLLDFKREFGVVNELLVYNTEFKRFECSGSKHIEDQITEMDKFRCFESLDHSFLTIEDQEYLIYKGEKLIAILSFDKDAAYNKVLLTLKVKKLISNLNELVC